MRFLWRFIKFLRGHKSFIFVFFVSLFLWPLLIFPFGDLSDLAGVKVGELTQNQYSLQFADMQISFLPFGLRFKDISLGTPMIGPIESQELTISPSPFMFFSKSPAGNITARTFGGNIELSMKSGSKSETGLSRQKIEIHAVRLRLQELQDVLLFPLSMKGLLSVDGVAQTDLALAENPDAEVLLKIEKFEFSSQTIDTGIGPIHFPSMKASSIEIKGRLSAGKFVIQEGKIGHENDEIYGTVKGDLMLNLQGGQIQMGAYNFDVDLTIRSSLEERLNLLLAAASQFKTPTHNASRYRLRLSGLNVSSPPSVTAAQ